MSDSFVGSGRAADPPPVEGLNPAGAVNQAGDDAPLAPTFNSAAAERSAIAAKAFAHAPIAYRAAHRVSRPKDFTQNAGRPGFVYIARNPYHRPGLCKVGQTTKQPSARIDELNEELHKDSAIGDFQLVGSVQVEDAYGCEQQLFGLLNDQRVSPKKEFFLLQDDQIAAVLERVALLSNAAPATQGPWHRR